MKRYLSIREASQRWGVSERRISQYILEGRKPGVERFGRLWANPKDAIKPADPRESENRRRAHEQKRRRKEKKAP